jgi:hypothetical protein
MVKHHRILGLVIDERMNWNKHFQDAKERTGKKLNLTKCLSQTTLLKIHQMIILSTLRYGETACGSASKAVLRKLDPIHHIGVRLAIGTFRAEFQELVNDKYNDYTRIYILQRRVKEVRKSSIRGRNRAAINTKKEKRSTINIQRGTQKLPTMEVRGVIFTDSLSTMTASRNDHTKNLKTRKFRELMDERKGNVTLCWVPGHAGIPGNEVADEEAKRALDESILNDENYPPEDLIGWIKTEMAGS